MKPKDIEKLEKEVERKYRKTDKKTTKKMVVDGAGVKQLASLIERKAKSVK